MNPLKITTDDFEEIILDQDKLPEDVLTNFAKIDEKLAGHYTNLEIFSEKVKQYTEAMRNLNRIIKLVEHDKLVIAQTAEAFQKLYGDAPTVTSAPTITPKSEPIPVAESQPTIPVVESQPPLEETKKWAVTFIMPDRTIIKEADMNNVLQLLAKRAVVIIDDVISILAIDKDVAQMILDVLQETGCAVDNDGLWRATTRDEKILFALKSGEKTALQLVAATKISKSTVYKQLKDLANNNKVKTIHDSVNNLKPVVWALPNIETLVPTTH
jgi:predicted transcriptional regulator